MLNNILNYDIIWKFRSGFIIGIKLFFKINYYFIGRGRDIEFYLRKLASQGRSSNY